MGRTEARVFRNWRVGKREEFERFIPPGSTPADGQVQIQRYYFGADWGFNIDPTVMVRCFIHGRTLYIDAEVYEKLVEIDHRPFLFGGCQDQELINMNSQAWNSLPVAKRNAWRGISGARRWPVIADSASPDNISYMQKHGFPRMTGARKGPGSVDEGVQFLQSNFDIVVHPDCQHTINELSTYSYKIDKKTEEVLPVLEDDDNHIIDSLRYALEPTRRALFSATCNACIWIAIARHS